MPSVSSKQGHPSGQSCSTLLHTTRFLYCNLNSTHRHQKGKSSAETAWLHFHSIASALDFEKSCSLCNAKVFGRSHRGWANPSHFLALLCHYSTFCVISPKILKTSMEWHVSNTTPDYQHVIMWDLMIGKENKYFPFSNDKYAYVAK